MVKKKIGIGLMGTGFMGKAHTNAYKTIPYIFHTAGYYPELAAVCGRNQEKTAYSATRYGYQKYYTNWQGIINDKNVDIVDVSTSNDFHMEPAIAATKANKHVLCEKPMALHSDMAKEMYFAAEKQHVVNMVCFTYRFLPAVRLAYEMIQQDVIGNLRHMHVRYFQDGGADADLEREHTWYARPPATGVLQGIGVHAIDQARFLFGEIGSLCGLASTHVKTRMSNGHQVPIEIEDSAEAIVEFVNGAAGVIECSCASWGRKNQLAWELYGSKGSLAFDLENPNYLQVYLKDSVTPHTDGFANVNVTLPEHPFMDVWWPTGHNIGWEHAHINLIAHFLDCVASNTCVYPLGATFEDGYKAALIVDAIRETSATGQMIDMTKRYTKP